MSAPILSFKTAQTRRSGIRLRLKPAHQACGSVHGAWWPRTDQLHTELPLLLAALSPRVGCVDRVIYDETDWAPASLRMEFKGRSIILEASSTTSTNIVSLIGRGSAGWFCWSFPPTPTQPARTQP